MKDDENFVPKAFQKQKSENNKNRKKDKAKKKNNKRKNNKVKKILIILLIIISIILAIGLGISSYTWITLANDMRFMQNSVVKDIDGNTIATIGSSKNKKYVKIDNIPENLKNAYVAIEDERFYSHKGVDIKRTSSAIASYVLHFGSSSYGGSTITQQLVKNYTGDNTDDVTRKIKEWWKAFLLECCMSKDEILEGYFNAIYVGPNIYGVETGAKYYFNKSTKDLTLAECAFLAGINNSPNTYNPFSDNPNYEKINKRTKIVLTKMKDLKYISDEDYKKAVNEVDSKLNFKKGSITENKDIYSYHTDAVLSEVIKDIKNKYHISEKFVNNYLEMAGLTIYSTQDSNIQNKMDSEFNKSKYILKSKNDNNHSQSAMVIIDHKTGNVLGCMGGLGKKNESRSFNRATQSVRQTGSAIKPIAVLAPAIDKKIITASFIYDDTKQDFGNGYCPIDYSEQLGKITVRRAVESSQNIPFVIIMKKLTPNTSMKYLKKMGITSLTEKDNNLALALGGLEKGISPLEMAGAYSTIANDGVYIKPTFYKKVDKIDGSTIVESKQKSKRVFSKEVAYILKNILTQPVKGNNGTATYCKISGVDVAAKTGTTDDNYDRWLCGFTPYYTAVTWYGYDQNETIEFNRKNPAGLIWANVMSRIHVGKNKAIFEIPNKIISCKVCSKTGKKARSGCTDVYTEYFLKSTEPDMCNEHSGNELKTNDDKNNDVQTKIQDKIQEITKDIDAEDPQQLLPKFNDQTKVEKNNSNNTNTVNNIKPNTNNTNSTNNINSTNVVTNNSINTNKIENNTTNVTINSNKTNTNITNTNISSNNINEKNNDKNVGQ